MADPDTGADALAFHLTGAASDGAAQPDPDASLGAYRAADRAEPLGVLLSGALPGVRIVRAAGLSGAGTAALSAIGADALAWAPPGEALGEAVEVAEGETVRLPGPAHPPVWPALSLEAWAEMTVEGWAELALAGGGADACAVVTRTGAADLAGEAAVHLDGVVGGVVGGSRQTSAGAAYRCLALRNATGDGRTLGLWHLADPEDRSLADAATGAHDLTNDGAEHVEGEGYRFVRADGDYMVAAFPAQPERSALTIEAWVRGQMEVDQTGVVAAFGISSQDCLDLHVRRDPDPARSYITVALAIGDVEVGRGIWRSSDVDAMLAGGAAVHVAGVLEAPNRLTLYVDGIARDEDTVDIAALPAGDYTFRLGRWISGWSGWDLSAILDEVRLSAAARYDGTFTPPVRHAEAVLSDLVVWQAPDRTLQVLSAAYGAGAAEVEIDGDLAAWPPSGWAMNVASREVLFYASRTASALSVPADGRDPWDETAGGAGVGVAGAAGDRLVLVGPVRLGLEAPASQPDGALTEAADETDAPAGVTFVHPPAPGDADALAVGTLPAGYVQGVWIERMALSRTGGGLWPEPRRWAGLAARWTDVEGAEHLAALGGLGRTGDLERDAYALYHGVDAEPDFEVAPEETFDALPHAVALSAGHTHRLVVRRRNPWGLESQNVASWSVTLDAEGAVEAEPPSAPDVIAVSPAADGDFRVTAEYPYEADGDDQATQWVLWASWGADPADPDPEDEPTAVVAMAKGTGLARLEWTAGESLTDGWTVKALVRTRRIDDGPTAVDSTNADPVQTTVTVDGPEAPAVQVHRGTVEKEA